MAGRYPRTLTHIRTATKILEAAQQYADDEYLGPTYFRDTLKQVEAALKLADKEARKEIDEVENRRKAVAGEAP